MSSKHFTTEAFAAYFRQTVPKPKHHEFDGHVEHRAIRRNQIQTVRDLLDGRRNAH